MNETAATEDDFVNNMSKEVFYDTIKINP